MNGEPRFAARTGPNSGLYPGDVMAFFLDAKRAGGQARRRYTTTARSSTSSRGGSRGGWTPKRSTRLMPRLTPTPGGPDEEAASEEFEVLVESSVEFIQQFPQLAHCPQAAEQRGVDDRLHLDTPPYPSLPQKALYTLAQKQNQGGYLSSHPDADTYCVRGPDAPGRVVSSGGLRNIYAKTQEAYKEELERSGLTDRSHPTFD